MFYILPTRFFSLELYENSKEYTNDNKLTELSKSNAVEIILAIVEEQLFNRLYWTDKVANSNVEETLYNSLEWWSSLCGDNRSSEICQAYYSTVIDEVEIKIAEFIDNIAGECNTEAMWLMWYTKRLGDDLVIERGEDYRIVEYERRQLNALLEDCGEDDGDLV